MSKFFRYVVFILLFFPVTAAADDERKKNEPKVISGMSIVGNDETPKSLFIVPWKSSSDGKMVDFTSNVLNEDLSPVDKSDIIRELDLYKLREH